MILAEKIALQRRQHGWSQEELADRLDVSRQAVSKWEGSASIPDLDKILKMSELFGVSTDYLLKDGIEQPDALSVAATPQAADDAEPLRSISLEEANAYLDLVRAARGRIAAGVGLFILSPAPLLLLGGWANGTPREDLAAGLGIAALLILIAVGLLLVLPPAIRLEQYDYLEKEPFALAYSVAGSVEQKRAAFAPAYRRAITVGVALCVLCVVPLTVAGALGGGDFALAAGVALILAIIAVAVQFLIRAQLVQESCDKLLQTGDYTLHNKRLNRRIGWVSGAYWCAVTALYLAVSLAASSWATSWIIWPVAGVLYGALCFPLHAWAEKKEA